VTGTRHSLIAVVDDEPGVRTMLRRVLRHARYDVVTFASGGEFLDSLREQAPACVILDVHMPGLSGLEVLSRMRDLACSMRAILITASDDPALDRTVAEAGGVALLRKPFESDRLLEEVEKALRAASRGA
jgi:FixJ family two-component response regulator